MAMEQNDMATSTVRLMKDLGTSPTYARSSKKHHGWQSGVASGSG